MFRFEKDEQRSERAIGVSQLRDDTELVRTQSSPFGFSLLRNSQIPFGIGIAISEVKRVFANRYLETTALLTLRAERDFCTRLTSPLCKGVARRLP